MSCTSSCDTDARFGIKCPHERESSYSMPKEIVRKEESKSYFQSSCTSSCDTDARFGKRCPHEPETETKYDLKERIQTVKQQETKTNSFVPSRCTSSCDTDARFGKKCPHE